MTENMNDAPKKLTAFEAADYLDDAAEVEGYLEDAIKAGDPDVIKDAEQVVARGKRKEGSAFRKRFCSILKMESLI